MIIFRSIFSIVFTPIRLLVNLLTKHKGNVLEWHLNYGPSFVNIKTRQQGQSLPDGLLIASYILFLARYFYICDERQVDIVRNFLLEQIKESNKPNEITPRLYEVIFQALSQTEKNVTLDLFRTYSRVLPIPPLTFSEDEEPSHSFAKYNFLVFERTGGNGLSHIFHMSTGPDIILLPLTVGILYEYVTNKLRDKDKKEKLDNSIIDLLKKHSVVDCRSIAGQTELPNEIIGNNNLGY